MTNGLEAIVEQLAETNILVARGRAREDDTIDVNEDDRRAPDAETQADDAAAADRDD